MTFLKNKQNGVYLLSPIVNDFEEIYLKVRALENRVVDQATLKILPNPPKGTSGYEQWMMRKSSTRRFMQCQTFLEAKNILDIGCGNGWFANKMAKHNPNTNVFALDVNLFELKEGAKAFDRENLHFLYADIFHANLPAKYFDLVVLNSVIQYFDDIPKLFNRIFSLLTDDGNIHIIDSPFYKSNEVKAARKRSQDYYEGLGYPSMADNYNHHSWDVLTSYNTKKMYNPTRHKLINKIKGKKDTPFCWIKICK